MNVILKDFKEHDSTLFQSNGLGAKIVKNLNVKQIKCVKANLTKVRQDMEALENKNRSYESTFKGIHKQHSNKRRWKKVNCRRPKQFMESVLDIFHNPLCTLRP